jgi:PKD repeat protein
LYAAKENQTLFRSDNVNDPDVDWTSLTAGLPSNSSINDLEAHPFNPDMVYLCQGTEVFKSVDKGVTWQNITGSLPDVTVNDIAYYKNSQEGLYVGTDIGVFYRDMFLDDWILFDNGFPTSGRVTEVEIYYEAGDPAGDVIRAATYGRGLWSSPMYHDEPVADFQSQHEIVPPSCPVDFMDMSAGVPTAWEWTFEGGNPSTSNVMNPTDISFDTPGTYDVTLTVTNDMGTDTKILEDFITVDETLMPLVEFSASNQAICSGEVVYFTDETEYCPESWQWSFQPDDILFMEGTSTQSQNPAVQFLSNATYSVTLEATSTNGSSVLEKEDFILAGGFALPFAADFSQSFAAQNWEVDNPDSQTTWEITQPEWSPNGTNAAYMNFFMYTNMNERDNLISPALSLVGVTDPHLMFNYAYTYRFSLYDSLIIKISEDCGETWHRIYANGPDGSGIFATTEALSTTFNPSSPEEWCGNGWGAECVSISLAEYEGAQNVKFMFQGMNKYGNNLYISDIEISSPTGVNSQISTNKNFKIHPNPNYGIFTISTQVDKEYYIEIFNAQGQLIKSKTANGNAVVQLNNDNPGIYFVKIRNAEINVIEKIIIR